MTGFGLSSAASYAFSGLVDWTLAGVFITGGIVGGFLGARLARELAGWEGALNTILAAVISAVALYILLGQARSA